MNDDRRGEGLPAQAERLRELRTSRRYALLIVDSCRFDVFFERVSEGAVEVESNARWTKEWYVSNWAGRHAATLVSANPRAFSYEGGGFAEEVACPRGSHPGDVCEAVRSHSDVDRIVAHFHQVHVPYHLADRPEYDLFRTEPAELASPAELRRAYTQELVWAMTMYVLPLARDFEDRRVVVTADHAELLGEDGLYGHYVTGEGPIDHPLLRSVPWLELS